MARKQRILWTFEPRRRELIEHLGPAILRALSWALALVIAIPLFLSVFAAVLV